MIFRLLNFLYKFLLVKPRSVNAFVSASPTVKGLQNVTFKGNNLVPEFCNFSGKISIDSKTTLGVHNFLHGDITIGKYCQVGAYVAMHTTNHPISHLTTYINRMLLKGELAQLKTSGKISIGHDVWIGHAAIIVGSVTIGNGAIIAAGAVVTSDVPAYSIVAGVPAKILRYRFSETVIQEIEQLRWWDKPDAELESIRNLFFKNLADAKSIHS